MSGCVDALQASARPSVPAAFSAPVLKPPRSSAGAVPAPAARRPGVRVVGQPEHADAEHEEQPGHAERPRLVEEAARPARAAPARRRAAAGIRSPSGHGIAAPA